MSAELDLTLTVAHLDHQLRGPESQADADFVREIAARWHLPCYIEAQPVSAIAKQRKLSLEEAARQARYAFLWRVASQTNASKICVGHNADDQVETVLMHFLRGAGLNGLRGILPVINLETLRLPPEDCPADPSRPAPSLIRPLLEIPRSEIEAYCRQNNLTPRQDHSNQDTTYFRNRLRHNLIPQLESYNPNIRQVLRHTATVVAAEAQLLTNLLDQTWAQTVRTETAEEIVFDLAGWLNLPVGLKRSTVRRAVHRLRRQLRDINFVHVENAIKVLEKGRTGSLATLPQGLVLTVSYQSFTISTEGEPSRPRPLNQPHLRQDQVVKLEIPGVTQLPFCGWQLEAEISSIGDLESHDFKQLGRWEVCLDADVVGHEAILCTRRPGNIFFPLGMAGHRKKVNEFMIDQKIPVKWRNHVPLLVAGNRILWICGYRSDERARIQAHTKQVLSLRFEPL
jgi:tRNA(Ile)-lysidine synthase